MPSDSRQYVHLSSQAYAELRQALDDAGVLVVHSGPPLAGVGEALSLSGVLVLEDPEKPSCVSTSRTSSR